MRRCFSVKGYTRKGHRVKGHKRCITVKKRATKARKKRRKR